MVGLRALLALGAAVFAPLLCRAQSSSERRPAFAQREAKVFDFEEIETSPAPVPSYWVRAQDSPDAGRNRPGFPIWNAAELDGTHAHGGIGSVKLPTRGGSTSLLLERGVLPVFQRADYAVTAHILTDGIRHARARLVARLLDAEGELVPGSERPSELIVSQGHWSPVRVELPGDFDTASFLQIELQLLQPSQFQANAIGQRQVLSEDFEGAAWFDDVTVSQLPRIQISTASPSNVFVAPARPDINFLVRDLTGEKLTVHLSLTDAADRVVDQQTRQLTTGRTMGVWQPDTTKLGWYRATLAVQSAGKVLATIYVDFLWIPPAGPSDSGTIRGELGGSLADWKRFELVATDPNPRLVAALPELLDRVGVGAVSLPIWDGLYDAAKESASRLGSSSLVTRLLERGRQVTLSMPRLPQDLSDSARVDPEDPWELARKGPELWGPFVDRYLDRFGQSIRRWEIGSPWDDRIFWDPSRKKTLASVVKVFERLVPGPIICVPWRADLAVTPQILRELPRDASIRFFVPEDMPASSIAVLANSLKAAEGMGGSGGASQGKAPKHDITVVLGTSFDERATMLDGAAETARRLVEFWKAFGEDPGASVALLQPWSWTTDSPSELTPRPEMAVMANIIPRLSGRRFVGELPSAPGLRALVFAPAGDMDSTDQGVLVAWSESDSASGPLRAYLGASPVRAFDVFGNEIAPGDPQDEAARFRSGLSKGGWSPEALLRLRNDPIIVEGVDPRLAIFQAGVQIDPPMIEASAKSHEHSIVVSNPWPVPVEVNVRVVKPGGVEGADSRRDRSWHITPRQARVLVEAGKQQRIPVEFSFSPGEEAGMKDFVMDVDVASDQSLGSLRIHRDVELGSAVLDVQVTAKIDADQNVIVEAYTSNRGKSPVDLQLTAFAPGLSRSKGVITNLLPGGVGLRAFRYDNAGALRGQRVYVTVEDVAGSIRLNKAVVIE